MFRLSSRGPRYLPSSRGYTERSLCVTRHTCRVLKPETNQEAAFGAVEDYVQSALDGYHVCLFFYGQTGSGKTYTMIGDTDMPAASSPNRGIVPRAVAMIIAATEKPNAFGWQFDTQATFIEVFKKSLRDLLADVESGPGHTYTGGPPLLDSAAIKHDPDGHTQVRVLLTTRAYVAL